LTTGRNWTVVDGHYPGFRELSGASFKVSVVMSATDVSFDQAMQREDDLQLMAAAPDLLKACRHALADLKGREHDQYLRDAIAKATGDA